MLLNDQLIFYPNKKLQQWSQKVDTSTQQAQIKKLYQVLCAVIVRERGLGLSAIQIGLPWQAFVMYPDTDCKQELICLINPRIIKKSSVTKKIPEGCLSIPGVIVQLERPQYVKVEYEDLQGKTKVQDFMNLMAVCVQHELDHCQGTLITDYLSTKDRNIVDSYYCQNQNRSFTHEPVKNSEVMIFNGSYSI